MQLDCELVIFDQSLTPNQVRCISEATDVKVIDRSMLILDIFARRALTREGKLAVELPNCSTFCPDWHIKTQRFPGLQAVLVVEVQVKRSSKLIDDGQETASAVLRSNLHKQKYSEKTDEEDAITVKSQRCLFSATQTPVRVQCSMQSPNRKYSQRTNSSPRSTSRLGVSVSLERGNWS